MNKEEVEGDEGMKKYRVSVSIDASKIWEVEAKNKEDAIEKVWKGNGKYVEDLDICEFRYVDDWKKFKEDSDAWEVESKGDEVE